MEQISNPLPPRKRGIIYSLGIVYGAAVGVAAQALLAMGMPEWAGVIGASAGVIGAATSALARANLSNPFEGGVK